MGGSESTQATVVLGAFVGPVPVFCKQVWMRGWQGGDEWWPGVPPSFGGARTTERWILHCERGWAAHGGGNRYVLPSAFAVRSPWRG